MQIVPKIIWPLTSEKGNPFGGIDGMRPLRITFHTRTLINISSSEEEALEILQGLATLDYIDAMSFGGEILPKIFIESHESGDGYTNIQTIDGSGVTLSYHLGVHKSYMDKDSVVSLMGSNNSNDEKNFLAARQELFEAEAHHALGRDILITQSQLLLNNRYKLTYLNIQTPSEALKVVGLYRRSRDKEEFVYQVKGNVKFRISRNYFYWFLARGFLPNSWKYVSGLPFNGKEIFLLGLSVLDRCTRVLQARDEIMQLYLMPGTSSSENKKMYHFDYLTLLLTAALDSEALILKKLFHLSIKDMNCGLRRSDFINAIERDNHTKPVADLLERKKEFVEILFMLRNKIHSSSIESKFNLPENYQNKLFDKMYNYEPESHWGIQKQKIKLIENGNPPIPAYDISIDIYNLTHHLLEEGLALIDDVMRETKVEATLDAVSVGKIIEEPPPDLALDIKMCVLLG
jgi:hypothetical protein